MSSLWEQLEQRGIDKKKSIELTPEVLKDFMVEIAKEDLKNGRNFITLTGASGAWMLSEAVQREAYFEILKDAPDSQISTKDKKKLIKMMHSPDPENWQVAKEIINKLIKKDGSI